jgi:hypothetical protein
MKSILQKQIEELKRQIENDNFSVENENIDDWGGADVIITRKMNDDFKAWLGDQPIVISSQKNMPRRRLVVTEYSKELTYLFYQLQKIFSEKIDYISKYDFYGSLAQSAIDYLKENENPQNPKELLIEVLNTAKRFYEEELSD